MDDLKHGKDSDIMKSSPVIQINFIISNRFLPIFGLHFASLCYLWHETSLNMNIFDILQSKRGL